MYLKLLKFNIAKWVFLLLLPFISANQMLKIQSVAAFYIFILSTKYLVSKQNEINFLSNIIQLDLLYKNKQKSIIRK